MASELLLAEERERQRLAESLHDGPSQALFRARLKLDQLSLSEPRAREISTILEDIGKMLNTMTFELSPVVLRTLGLRHAIRSLAGDMQQRYGLSIKIQDDGKEITLDERVVLILFRSVRELLINIVKHARTAKATLSIKKVDNRLQIAIEDRGKGFDLGEQSGQVERGHFGLFSIRERLAYLGGSFNVRSAPGKGTSVTLNAPLLAQAAAAHSNQAG
jgi:signal transduction histidine kinase